MSGLDALWVLGGIALIFFIAWRKANARTGGGVSTEWGFTFYKWYFGLMALAFICLMIFG